MASIKKYETASGHAWRVQYRSPDGRSRTKQGFRTKSEAQAWSDKNAVTIHEHNWINPNAGKVTVGELGPRWLATLTHLKPSTYRVVNQHWRNHVEPRWGTTPIATIKRSEVQEWVATIPKSATIVRGAHNALLQILDLAVADRAIRTNPAKGVKLPHKPKAVKVYLTATQLRELAEECSVHGELVWLLGTSGLRFGEAVALTPADLDPLRNRIHVRRNAVTVGSKVAMGTPKSGQARTVAVAPAVMAMLVKLAERKAADAFLWARADGTPLQTPGHGSWFDGAVSRCVARNARAVAKAQAEGVEPPRVFPRLTPHGLRHVAAGLLVSAGANVKVVQRQLGHASAAMTLDTYADLFDDDLDAVVVALDGVVAGDNSAHVVELSWDCAGK